VCTSEQCLVTDDDKIALVDLGLVGHLPVRTLERLLELQSVANRVVLGLVMAATLIVQVPTTFRLLGHPRLALIVRLAGSAGAMLAIQIVSHDRRSRRGRTRRWISINRPKRPIRCLTRA